MMDREYVTHTNMDGHTWTEYKMDPKIARIILDMKDGLNGCRLHSWRALSIEVTGMEDQIMGQELERIARWTLGEEV